MIDLDYLREVNNAHGHLAGDAVVTAIAKVIGASARATDMPARFGGEEFALLMPATPLDAAIGVAERVRIAVEETGVATEGVVIHATVSIGVASGPGTLEELIRRADKALYAQRQPDATASWWRTSRRRTTATIVAPSPCPREAR